VTFSRAITGIGKKCAALQREACALRKGQPQRRALS
jgi:hypothetical protein